MAACPEVEEKTSSIEDSAHFKSFFEESTNSTLTEATCKFSEESRTGDLTTLSDDEFLHLLKEASTFNKPNQQESVLLKQLRKEVAETELRENVNEHTEHKHSKIIICNTASSANHKTFDGKKKNKYKEDSKSALNSDKTVLQSISLQDLLNPEIKAKKSHKAYRTLSLSSEEAAAIVSDSLIANSKSSKKSNKQSNSKSDTTKSNIVKSNSKGSSQLGGPSTSDSGQKRKYDALVQNSSLPYETLINECDIPLPDETEKSTSASLIEIDLESTRNRSAADVSEIVNIEKSNVQERSSKFYVDSSEVDATVAFPLQLVSSMENGPVNFPLVPWPRPVQVQTLLGVPLDVSILTRSNDKQLLNADINGNPFSRTSRPSSLASFVSTTLLDYNNSNLVSENKNRKNKRLRNAVNKGVLSENIAGHRGEEDIDTLLQYINSSDKKGKAVKGNSPNQMLGSKSMIHESERKKSFGKEIKNNHKNMILKKKLSRSNSLENLFSDSKNQVKLNSLSYASNAILDKPLKSSKSACFENPQTLDINSNVELPFVGEKLKNSSFIVESDSAVSTLEPDSSEVSSFAADFYSTADVSSQTVEESGFLIVKKKGRKKRQGKRSDSYRWRTAQTQRKKGMMLPLADSKCGKQDSRRKSTSSVPHSEHSSADNSDLDSVHSLPVRGSVPHPTQPHPHTTPSSSSSTPQASYADIARMPIPKLSSNSCIMTCSAPAKPQTAAEQDSKKAETSNLLCNKRRFSDVRENTPLQSKNYASLWIASDNIDSDVKFRSEAKSTREINTQTEPVPSPNETKSKKADEPCKAICSICACPIKKNCLCVKPSRQKYKSSDIPPVIMDNVPAESDACNISFGFGVEEVLQMTPEKELLPLQIKSENLDASSLERSETVNSESCSAQGTSHLKSDLFGKASSHLQTVCYGTGRNICYGETKVNTKKFNLSEITNFLGSEFKFIESELDFNQNPGTRIAYYVDSAEEA